MLEHKHESSGQFVNHEFCLPKIKIRLKANVRTSSTDSSVAPTHKDFGDEQLYASPGEVILLDPTAPGKDEGDRDFKGM